MSADDTRSAAAETEELYLEPAPLRGKDLAGVIIALLALAVIGVGGYIWLNPALDSSSVRTWLAGGGSEPAGGPAASADSEFKCAYCGMFANRSKSHIEAYTSAGARLHFDCWDCAFRHAADNGTQLGHLHVADYGSETAAPHWLEGEAAHYLYDTETAVEGSMPPYTAAFASAAEAEAARSALGGTLLDFKGLLARFSAVKLVAADSRVPASAPATPAADASTAQDEPGAAEPSGGDGAQAHAVLPADTAPADAAAEDASCPYCGMNAQASVTHVRTVWSDGSVAHYDCFDCMYQWGKQQALSAAEVKVTAYGGGWLDARTAAYLYGVKKLKGSMPPYVAAFDSRTAAEQQQPELGGEIADYDELMNRLASQ